jgi:hypothetical protein
MAPVFWIAVNRFPHVDFDESALTRFCEGEIQNLNRWERVVASSIRKDSSCFLRTYAGKRSARLSVEESLDGPLRTLRLITCEAGRAAYRFRIGQKESLPPEVFGFAIHEWLMAAESGARSATISRLLEPGAPGRVFRLDELAVRDLLDALEATHPDLLQLARPAGELQIMMDGATDFTGVELLDRFYGSHAARAFVKVPA